MKVMNRYLAAAIALASLIAAHNVGVQSSSRTHKAGFVSLMNTVSVGWNEGDAGKAANCFAENAVYMEPPNRQVYVGRRAIYEFFGGPNRPNPPMKMEWHHLAWNSDEQVGYGEFTFQGQHRYHGIVTVLIDNGKISKWREYQYRSEANWDDFVGKSRF